jgi:hypothetical protein
MPRLLLLLVGLVKGDLSLLFGRNVADYGHQ